MSQTAASPQVRASPSLFILIHAAFVLTGMVTTLLGPILPALSARWSLEDSQAGYLFTSQFFGSMAGVALSSALIPRRGFQSSLVLGLGMMGAGVGTLALGTWAIGLLSVFCYGIGLGITIPAANLLVADANPGRRAAALNILNLAWGMGAVACPPLAASLHRGNNFRLLLLGLALALGLMLVCIASISFSGLRDEPGQVDPPVHTRAIAWRSRFAPVLGALFFLYVGTESSLGGWIASYAQRVSTAPASEWMLTPSAFWGALLLGRALAPAVLRHVAETTHVLVGLLLAVLGVATLLAADSLPVVVAGAGLAGLGLGPVFPITVAILSHHFGSLASRVAGLMFALSGLGGATLPWLVGFLSTHSGSLKAGLVVPLLGSLGMSALYLANLRATTSTGLRSQN